MLADGSVSGCLMTPEESDRIARLEGISLSGRPSSKLQPTKPINSNSYIIIECASDADPKFNRLQLRTNPPTFIELHPGINKLSIKAYPNLKYGFRQIEDCIIDDDTVNTTNRYEYNCGAINRIDLSHFDSSEVSQMNNMFERMECLSQINFGSIRFKNITSIENAFDWVGAGWNANDGDLLDLSNIDFSQVLDTTEMLYGCNFHTVNLTGCDMSKVQCANDMFYTCGIRKLILDGSKLSNAVIEAITELVRDWCSLEEVSLKGCEMDTIKSIISGLTHYRPRTWGSIKFIFEKTLDSKQLIEMSITATKNALECLDWHPEFNLPFTAYECFAGITTIDGLDTPDLAFGLADMDEILTRIKDELREQIKDISPKSSSLSPLTMSLNYIVDNIDITLITEEDSRSGTHIPVRNLFKYQITQNNEDSYEVVCPPEPRDNLLGVYLPQTGSIMLWIDRIVQKDRPELIFQKVLLHEMIHAFLDIYPRVYFKYYNRMCSILTAIGKKDTTESEETIDNILVLDCYSHCGKEYYDFVKEFISNQPDEYKAAIDMYEPKKEVYSIIKAHLNDKVSCNESFDISHNVNYYVVADDDISDEELLIEVYINGLVGLRFSTFFSFIYNCDRKSNGIYDTRFLLYRTIPNFQSPWITFRLNLSTKIISLRIGDIICYQVNPINYYEECFDLLNHKKIKEFEDLDFKISREDLELIQHLISIINPNFSVF